MENKMSNLSPENPGFNPGVPQNGYAQTPPPPTGYTPIPGNIGASASGSIMETAKWGMYGLIATGIGFVLGILQLPFIPGLLSLAGLVMAIMSLVKKETPKWPAWVTIGLAIASFAIILIGILIIAAGLAIFSAV